MAHGPETRRTNSPRTGRPWRWAYAPDGATLALGTLAVGVRLCDPASGRERARLGQNAGVVALAYGPDGGTLAAAAGWSITLSDVAEMEVRATLKGHRGPVWSLALSPDGRTLVSGGQDGTVRLWDVASGREQACFDWKLGAVRCVAFAPDGMTAVAAGKAGPLVLWDVE